MKTLLAHTKEINEQLARYGVKFGIYKDGTFNERLFPFDPVPRQIPEKDYKVLEKGLIQRVTALNRFIYDIYHDKAGRVCIPFPRLSGPVRGHHAIQRSVQPHFRYRFGGRQGRRVVYIGR